MKTPILTVSVCAYACALVPAALVYDDFESNTYPSGGSGWSGGWSGTSNTFDADAIDGDHARGVYTGDGGVKVISRSFTPISTGTVSMSWSFKGTGGFSNFDEIGLNIRGLKSNGDTYVATLKFDDDFSSTLRLNDGNVDFSSGSVGYADGAIYDFTFSSITGTSQYSWSVTQRGGSTASGTGFNYSFGHTLTNVSGVEFFWQAAGTAGNDGFIDNLMVVPEPTAALFGGIGALLLLRRRR